MVCPPLLGIYDGISETDIVKLLGDPNDEQMDGMFKKISYESSALALFRKDEIYMLGVTNFARQLRRHRQGWIANLCPMGAKLGDTSMKPGATVTNDGTGSVSNHAVGR